VRSVAVICPSFVADCLETLEEIAIAGEARFRAAGGIQLTYIKALNVAPVWVDALGAMISERLPAPR
jgi:ferrochelatase